MGGGLSHVFILGPLGPFQAIPVDPDESLAPGAYTAVVAPNGDVGLTWRTRWPMSGGAVAATDHVSATEVLVPYVARNADGATSLISILSTNVEARQSVTVTVRGSAETGRSVEVTYSLMPGGSTTLDLGQDTAFMPLGDGFVGSAVIRGEFPVVVDALVDVQGSENGVMSFEGSSADAAWGSGIAPLVAHEAGLVPDQDGSPVLSSSIAVMNPGSEPADVRIRYRGVTGETGCADEIFEGPDVSVPAGSAVVISQSDSSSGLPHGCLGSATVSSESDVVATAVLRSQKGLAAAYNLLPTNLASERVLFPRFRKDADGVTSLTAVANVGQTQADVVVNLGDDSGDPLGVCASCSLSIPPDDTRLLWLASASDVADGSSGELVLESTGRSVAVMVEVPLDSDWDMTAVQGQSATDDHRSHWLPAWWNNATRPTPESSVTWTATATDTTPDDTPTATSSQETPDVTPSATSHGPGSSRTFLPRVLKGSRH